MASPAELLLELTRNLAQEVYWAREETIVTVDIHELYMQLGALDRKAIVFEIRDNPQLLAKWLEDRQEIMENIQGLQEYRESLRSQPRLLRE